jgi:Kazal-type serine protease inhibitor domain.
MENICIWNLFCVNDIYARYAGMQSLLYIKLNMISKLQKWTLFLRGRAINIDNSRIRRVVVILVFISCYLFPPMFYFMFSKWLIRIVFYVYENLLIDKCGPQCQTTNQHVCGSNGVTYNSECHLTYDSCKKNTRIIVSSARPCNGGKFMLLLFLKCQPPLLCNI